MLLLLAGWPDRSSPPLRRFDGNRGSRAGSELDLVCGILFQRQLGNFRVKKRKIFLKKVEHGDLSS